MGKVKWWADIQQWPASLKWMVYTSLFILFGLMVLGCFWYYNGLANVINWDIISQLEEKVVQQKALSVGGLDFQVPEKLFFLKEFYTPSSLQGNPFIHQVFITSICIGMIFFLAGISNKGGIYFLVGVVSIAAFCLLLRLENVFQTTQNWPFFVGFMILGGLLYYLSNFKRLWSIRLRFSAFGLAFILLSLGVFFFKKSPLSSQALSSFGILFAIGVSLVFIFWVAQEIFVMMLALVGKSSIRGKSALTSYGIIGLILILNFLLIYLENARYIDESIFILNPIFLLSLSTVIGLWGLYKYVEDISVTSFQQTAFWVYIGAAIITFAAVCFVLATVNDPLIEFYKDYISSAFLVVTLALFCHGIVNFSGLLRQGYDVYKIFWKPKVSRLILARIGAVFLLAFLFSQKNLFMYDQVRAGLAIAQADFYLESGETRAAETFYKESLIYDMYNHKANYALASIAKEQSDGVNASLFFKQANNRSPSPYAYAGLSQHLQKEGLFFDAIFTTKEGLEAFPNNAHLHTNLAHLMEQAKQQDSTFYYQDRAYGLCYDCKVEGTNLLAFWLQNGIKDSINTQVKDIDRFEYQSFEANLMAIQRLTKDSLLTKKAFDVSGLSVGAFAELYNYISLGGTAPDSTLEGIQQHAANQSYAQDIAFIRAVNFYRNGEKMEAIKKLATLAQRNDSESALIRTQLAVWYLNEGLYDQGLKYFGMAGDSATVAVLAQSSLKTNLATRAEIQALKLASKELTDENYEQVLAQAPFNPLVVERVSDFLNSQGKTLEAYQLWNSLVDFLPESEVAWKNYTLLALQNGVKSYAEVGKESLQILMDKPAFDAFLVQYEREAEKLNAVFE